MAHHIYHTEAIVLSLRNAGEANRILSILTKDSGLLLAFTKSVRLEKSKLRYSLQAHSLTNVSLIRGKDMWRIIGAREIKSFHAKTQESRLRKELLAKLSTLLCRLMQGEAHDPYIFEITQNAFEAITDPLNTEETLDNIECLAVLRILYSLGYVNPPKILSSALIGSDFNQIHRDAVASVRRDAIGLINDALRASNL